MTDLKNAVSPDGEWLVFYTGSVEEPYNLTLNLLSIPDGEIVPVSRLLSGDMAENLTAVAEYYAQQGDELLGWETLKMFVFDHSIFSVAWSPDSRFLAFAGQMDGPSSDLYIFDVQTGEIQRKTDDLRILSDISWSPDGGWLVIQNTVPGTVQNGSSLHLIKASGGIVKNPPVLEKGFRWAGYGWATPSMYMITNAPEGGDLNGLRYLNVKTETIIDLWPGIYFAYAVDPENKIIAISGAPERSADGSYLEYGLYFVSFDGQKKKLTDTIYWELYFCGGVDNQFIGNDGIKMDAISKDGNITELNVESDATPSYFLLSPNKQWFVLYGASGTMMLYSANDQLVRTFPEIKTEDALWRADSSGLIVINGKELFFISIPDGEPVKIDQCPLDDRSCWFHEQDMVWIP